MVFFLFFLPLNLFASITVATYNVENFFEKNIGKKAKIHKVVKAMGYPDFLALQEVETEGSFLLRDYKIVMAQHKDKRGLGVAFLFKKGKLIKQGELQVPGSRSMLHIQMKIEGKVISFFVVHWPSQRNPKRERALAAKILKKRIKKLNNKYFLILGDFNFDPDFENIPNFKDSILRKLGGTYFYIPFRQWRNFDRIIWSKSITKILEYKIFMPDFLTQEFVNKGSRIKIPWKFNQENYQGYSDHFPVYLKYKF